MFYKRDINIFITGRSFLIFFNFTAVQRAEGDRLYEISKHSISYSKLLEPAGFFRFTLSRFFMQRKKPNCRSRSEPKTSLNQH